MLQRYDKQGVILEHIKVTIENDDVFVCDDCRKERKNCYKFSRWGYVYLCICGECFNRILDKTELAKEIPTDFMEFRGKR